MAETFDWQKVVDVVDQKEEECEALKKGCEFFMDRIAKDTKIISKQAKEIESLKKNQDPARVKAQREAYARVMGLKRDEDLLKRILEKIKG